MAIESAPKAAVKELSTVFVAVLITDTLLL
jgi:hypothetical protein